ncbi:hypothetical protein SteCoe_17258 [Stentor coeruleus]|uniref:Uncharacterized protein n=1 Tax=Stentor coeruleus TaxID=5963 RepID=A0A1R2BZM1_9CILI|nr:hypothetical protein SteCoe_17258 [Stentor coeruleus]
MLMSVSDDYSKEYKTSTVELVLYLLQSYTGYLEQQDALKLLNIMANLIDYSESSTLFEIIDLITEKWFGDKLIESSVHFNNKIGIYRTKLIGSSIYSLEIDSSFLYLTFPESLQISNTTVYDISIVNYKSSDNIFEVTLYESGVYINYNLILAKPEISMITYTEPILLSIQGTFDIYSNYECLYLKSNDWTTGACEIQNVKENEIKVKINQFSTFKISKASKNCQSWLGLIIIASLLVVLMIIFVTIFCVIDYDKTKPLRRRYFIMTFPIISIFFKQESPRRAHISMNIFTSWLLLLILIGLTIHFVDPPEHTTDYSFQYYYMYQISCGGIAWGLSQIYVLISLFLMTYPLKNFKKSYFYTISMILSAFVTTLCVFAFTLMILQYCIESTNLWIFTFVMFIPIDLIAQMIYSIIINLILSRMSYDDKVFMVMKSCNSSVFSEEAVKMVLENRHNNTIIIKKVYNAENIKIEDYQEEEESMDNAGNIKIEDYQEEESMDNAENMKIKDYQEEEEELMDNPEIEAENPTGKFENENLNNSNSLISLG